ncbi:MAG TPA: ElyC/SanA/YdcF family protein [Anaerolineales bacterium]|nr:ElyC/SanA/YdcF family protein [Anaerolineales bacterium]
MKSIIKVIKIAVLAGLAVILLPRLFTALYAASHTYTTQSVPAAPVAIVFGAGLWRDGTPTTVLRDRIATAAELYFSGKAQKVLMSGDNSYLDYNEPGAMRQYALSLGMPEDAIVLDYAGRRTYDTCFRAGAIFGIQQAILVTQGFHLPRALYTCYALGIKAVGVASDRQEYRTASLIYWNLRELAATLTALLQVHFTHPLPILGDPEPIFPTGNQ